MRYINLSVIMEGGARGREEADEIARLEKKIEALNGRVDELEEKIRGGGRETNAMTTLDELFAFQQEKLRRLG